MATRMRQLVRPPEMRRVGDSSRVATSWAELQKQYVEELVDKWSWLLEGTKKQKLTPIPERLWPAMAMLFENQVAHSSRGVLGEATLSGDQTLPQVYALPIIRKVFPALIVNKIASLQPMGANSGGVAKIYYLNAYREDVSPETNLSENDYDYSVGSEGSVPKRVRLEITSDSLTAVKDILGAVWSSEAQEDVRGSLGIDVENELVEQTAGEVLREIEQRVVYDIENLASAGDVTWSKTPSSSYTAKQWYETLFDALIDADTNIQKWRYRHADWIICGTEFASYLRKCADWTTIPRNNDIEQTLQTGVELIGEFTGQWDVYQSFYMSSNVAIMGVYPRTTLDTGYVYAPYIPLEVTPLVYASYDGPSADSPGRYVNNDEWTRSIRTRYGKKMVVPQMFAKITITS